MPELRIGLIGTGFMGRAHSNGYRQAPRFFPLQWTPTLTAVCGRDADKTRRFAENWGWQHVETDWRALVHRADIDAVDISTPNNLHHAIALEAAAAGKMVLCEKPLAMNVAEAEEMAAAVARSGQPSMVFFNYRRVPAVALARQMVEEGRLGRIFHYRAKYLQDWTMNPNLPQGGNTLWRLDGEAAGSGVTGDLLAHAIDLALWLVGPIAEVSAMSETFVRERPLQDAPETLKPVTVDDACTFLARFANGALATFEATRYATGRKNQNTFEINGEEGTLAFDLEDAHQLQYYRHADDALARGFRTIQVWDSKHPYMQHWWVPGAAIGYEHTFTHAIADFLIGLEQGVKRVPDFADGLATQSVCDAVLAAAADGRRHAIG